MITPFYIFSILFFIFGTIIGSFLNVLIYRLNTGVSSGGRSRCLSCGNTLSPFELVPVLSFLFLKGRCQKCGSKISFQYPLIEILTGVSFSLVYVKFSVALSTFSLFVFGEVLVALITIAILVAILAYDVRHKIIPNQFVYPFIFLSLAVALSRFFIEFQVHASLFLALDILSGPILFLFFYFLWRVSNGAWMGYGDAKLALGIGWSLGFIQGVSAIIFGFWVGAIFGLALIFLSRVLPALGLKSVPLLVTMKTEIPFAPFLILGMAIVFFYSPNVFFIF